MVNLLKVIVQVEFLVDNVSQVVIRMLSKNTETIVSNIKQLPDCSGALLVAGFLIQR